MIVDEGEPTLQAMGRQFMTNRLRAANYETQWGSVPQPSSVGDLSMPSDPVAIATHHRRGEPIRLRSCPGESWGRIIRGAARLSVADNLGERRIIDFILPGDYLEPAAYGHSFVAEAACDDTVMAHYRSRMDHRVGESGRSAAEEFRELSLATAARFRRQIIILGRVGAVAKFGAFLLDMETRLAPHGADRIVLPMSRYDIADYLAMSVETVSRCITGLRTRNAIALTGLREFRILDRAALEGGTSCLN